MRNKEHYYDPTASEAVRNVTKEERMNKIKAIIKRPDEAYGHVTWISNTLENFQRNVGGHIEPIALTKNLVVICNEDGKINNLDDNFYIGSRVQDMIKGEVIVCGVDGEEFSDVPIDLTSWKRMLTQWGN